MAKQAGAPLASRARKKSTPAAGRATPPVEARSVLSRLVSMGNATAATFALRFFKTGPGEYGEGDRFLGIRAPALRALARDLRGAGVEVALPLLKSGWHEARALGLLLLVRTYQRADASTQKRIYDLYLKSTKFINGWDLVDLSAEHIVGAWLANKPAERKRVLNRLATSGSMWERRIAILATFHSIKKGDYAETFRIAKILVNDDADLIQKAVGWMLREVGKRIGEDKEESFLKRYYRQMPRTMLRYAIERFAEPKRKRYLMGLV